MFNIYHVTAEPYVPDVPPAPNLDISDVPPPQESSTSIHSKTSRFSLRSARSHLTTRSSISQMSRVFRRGGSSAPASTSISHDRSNRASHIYREDDQHIPPLPNAVPIHQEHNITSGDSTSSKNIPVGIGRRLTKKGSIPSDWKQLQQLHFMETEREAAKFHSASKNNRDNERGSVLLDDLHAAHEGNYAKSESRYRTMRRQSLSVQEQGSLAYSKSDYRNNDSAPSSSSDKAMIASSNRPIASIGRADEAIADGTFNHTLAHNFTSTATCASMITVQPGDENLDSVGLKQAIATLREENNRLLSQFDDLEGKLHEKYGDPDIDAMRAPAQRRRESISLHSTSGRRMSTSSSIFSSQGRNSMIGYPKDAGSLAPTSPLSRRPSKTSSIASSSMRRGLNSSGSTHPGTMDTWLTSRPPSTVEEELLFTTGTPEGGTECLQSLASSNPHFEKEYRDLQERKSNIQEKYTARLEYLEARLQGQLNKEKLRR